MLSFRFNSKGANILLITLGIAVLCFFPVNNINAQVTCGNADGVGNIDVDDLIWMVDYAFNHGPDPLPDICVGNADGLNGVDIDDLIHMVNFAFKGGPPPLPGCCNTYWLDSDGDGYGDVSNPIYGSTQPPGYVSNDLDCNDNDASLNQDDADIDGVTSCDGDCDDSDPSRFPGNPEVCDGIDNDCNGQIDDNPVGGGTTFFYDNDGDSYGNPANSVIACSPPPGYVNNNLDCNDNDPTLNQADVDQDGWTSCDGDCDDSDGSIHPNQSDPCDGVDNDCDSFTDEDANCSAPNANSVCQGPSGCVLVSCTPGWADCDGNPANGCEVNLNNGASCNSFQNQQSMSGDGCGANHRVYGSRGEIVYRIYFTEECTNPFTSDDFNVRFILSSPTGVNYDLYVYNESCQLVGSSTSSGSTDQVTIIWNDNLTIDDSEYYRVEVRYAGGVSCSDWDLTIDSWATSANPKAPTEGGN